MSGLVDAPSEIRPGEELDVARLASFLRVRLGVTEPIELLQFPRGHSNLTYLVRAGSRQWVLRRPPFGSQVRGAHDMGREFRILSKLSSAWPKAPRPLAHCEDPDVLGAPFYVMERIEGVIVRAELPAGLPLRATCESFIDTLAELHAIDLGEAGLEDLGKPEGYNQRQVLGWSRRYENAQTGPAKEIEELGAWLRGRIPSESGASLVHNDYKLDNVVLAAQEPSRIIGVLDWEMSTLGDPLMDLGTTLAYWVQADDPEELRRIAFGPTMYEDAPTRRELTRLYADETGRDVSNALYFYAFGLFKTAVVLQQIHFRYRQGLTSDPRFASLGESARILARAGIRAIDAGAL